MGGQEHVYPKALPAQGSFTRALSAASSEMGLGQSWNRQGWSLPREIKPLVGESSMEMATCSPAKIKPTHPSVTAPYTAVVDVSAPPVRAPKDLHCLLGPVLALWLIHSRPPQV